MSAIGRPERHARGHTTTIYPRFLTSRPSSRQGRQSTEDSTDSWTVAPVFTSMTLMHDMDMPSESNSDRECGSSQLTAHNVKMAVQMVPRSYMCSNIVSSQAPPEGFAVALHYATCRCDRVQEIIISPLQGHWGARSSQRTRVPVGFTTLIHNGHQGYLAQFTNSLSVQISNHLLG